MNHAKDRSNELWTSSIERMTRFEAPFVAADVEEVAEAVRLMHPPAMKIMEQPILPQNPTRVEQSMDNNRPGYASLVGASAVSRSNQYAPRPVVYPDFETLREDTKMVTDGTIDLADNTFVKPPYLRDKNEEDRVLAAQRQVQQALENSMPYDTREDQYAA
jgi:hypothetical protein